MKITERYIPYTFNETDEKKDEEIKNDKKVNKDDKKKKESNNFIEEKKENPFEKKDDKEKDDDKKEEKKESSNLANKIVKGLAQQRKGLKFTSYLPHNFKEMGFNRNNRLKEAVDVKKIIKAVIDTNWSKDNESQMKVIELLRGIATSEESISNKFMKKIDDFTSGLKVEDFE